MVEKQGSGQGSKKSGACAPLFVCRIVARSTNSASAANSAVFLLPVPLDQNPAAIALLIVMSNPDCAGVRWATPIAFDPDVAVPVPTVIAVDPNPSRMRWMIMDFDDGCRRRNADNNLRHSNRGSETQGEQPCQKRLFHRNLNLRGSVLPESETLFPGD